MTKLLTLNIWGYRDWAQRKDSITALINRLSPDVVALQEVQLDFSISPFSQADYIAKECIFPYVVYTPGIRHERERNIKSFTTGLSHGIALLSKFPITQVEQYLLAQGEDFREPCALLFADILTDEGRLDICNVHFGNTDKESDLHIRELMAVCDARKSQPVLLGDFNVFDLREYVNNNVLRNYVASIEVEEYISIPKNNGTLDYIVIPKGYSFRSVECPEDYVSDHRAVYAEIVADE